ncbi:MAG: GerMN domain-containing protein [Candidatus Krumholzibacteria bacterium]|jgi:spore germination protein GerM|nr:GerMN domain-containing protein [Candidatus Krumholzibacteria bacterium]MDP6669106.1 GerMN domain-containing protein [Candidatus Krumholzibacteria bacterium]MDP6797485.1 GerMN domain-containing protein [Candidatus Krumholzibacteria bacterium]MDP7021975.1 GerMN domain-containing protein [Candidatus Krumholzibacteria bacterium]
MKRVLLLLLVLLACAPDAPEEARVPDEQLWDRSYGSQIRVLFFAEGSLDLRWREEARSLALQEDPADRIEVTLKELLRGPLQGKGRAFPEGSRMRQLFLEEGGHLVLDFGQETAQLLRWAGSVEERVALEALKRTLRVNFPELESLRILIAGQRQASLAGHLLIDERIELGAE